MSGHEERAHSPHGASSAHRWIACPGSINKTAGLPDETSIYAAEGTAAHELGEKCLKQGKDPVDFIGETIVVGNHAFEVDQDMADAVDVYVQAVRNDAEGHQVLRFIEHSFDLSDAIIEGAFGTNDAGLYFVDQQKINVYDYKHGAGVAVEVENNKQEKYYALGLLLDLYKSKKLIVRDVELVIVQPRAPHRDGPVRRWRTTAAELLEFQMDLAAAAQATLDPNAPLNPGPWCRFCKAEATCEAKRELALKEARLEFAPIPEDLDEEHLVALLDKASQIEDWIRAVRGYAYAKLQRGEEVPGWKLVNKKARRYWEHDNEDEIADEISSVYGIDRDDCFNVKLKSPAQMEKLLPKNSRERFNADYVVKRSSGVTLAREVDPRVAVAPDADAASDFSPIDD